MRVSSFASAAWMELGLYSENFGGVTTDEAVP